MADRTGEAWTEIKIPQQDVPDVDLLRDVVEPLVHTDFTEDIESWHFYWEPDLWLRLRWREPGRRERHERRLTETLERWRSEGRFDSFSVGRYEAEAEWYGPEVWDLIQKEWENGSEVALRTGLLNAEARLTQSIGWHWNRHVHLYTNRIFGSWLEEVGLCLAQADGYLAATIDGLEKQDGQDALLEKCKTAKAQLTQARAALE